MNGICPENVKYFCYFNNICVESITLYDLKLFQNFDHFIVYLTSVQLKDKENIIRIVAKTPYNTETPNPDDMKLLGSVSINV